MQLVAEALLLIYQLRYWVKCIPFDWNCRMFHKMYKVVQISLGQTVTCLHTNSPGHI